MNQNTNNTDDERTKKISFEMCSDAVVSALLFIELKSTLHFNKAISVFNLKFSIKKRRANTY